MSKVSYIIEFTIEDGKLDEFKKMATGLAAATEADEPESLTYQWYLAGDDRKCLLHEAFASSEAMLHHLGSVGPSLPDLLAIAPITRLEVMGAVSDAGREALAGLGPVHYPNRISGFER
jgi:quinol monooxygenase YgiN